jgi:filamentous hemagglutinin
MVLDTLGQARLDPAIAARVGQGGLPARVVEQVLQRNGVTASRLEQDLLLEVLQKATSQGHPAIAVVRSGANTRHAVVVDGVTTRMGQQVVAIRDPLGFQYFESADLFQSRWVNGQAILTNPR